MVEQQRALSTEQPCLMPHDLVALQTSLLFSDQACNDILSNRQHTTSTLVVQLASHEHGQAAI